MATHIITLAVETDETQTSPSGWDWSAILDSPYPADVLECTEVSTEVDDETIGIVLDALRDAHAHIDEVAPPAK